MTSEEYIETINKLMENQNNNFNIFLVIISLFVAAMAFLQWLYNSKESKLIEQRAVEKVLEEIHYKLGVKDITELNSKFFKVMDHQERIITILETFPDEMNLHLEGTIQSISNVSIKSNSFFESLELFLPVVFARGTLDYVKLIEDLLERLPSNYLISDSEKAAVENIVERLENIIDRLYETPNEYRPSIKEHINLKQQLLEYIK